MAALSKNSETSLTNRFTKTAIFVNQRSGRGRTRELLPSLERVFRSHGLTHEFFETVSTCDLESRAKRAIQQGANLLFSAGGDGTLQGLVNAAFGHAVTLGVVPAGCGNDFAHALGLPREPTAALDAALAGESRQVDLAKVRTADGSERLYLGGGGTGLDSDAARVANTTYRHWPGRLRYLAAAIHAYVRHPTRRVRVWFESRDEVTEWRDSILASVLNTPTFGAGIQLIPSARIDDGVLEFASLRDLPLGELLRNLPRLALRGTVCLPALQVVQTRKLRIETDPPAMFQGDGELLGPAPVEIEVVPRAVQFLAPEVRS